ncbi:MAG: peptidylprolyl isomerase [Planctomycetota bacterium]|nr:MAG: peptidylprolyl isomerase [Planctomycetota bacterium]
MTLIDLETTDLSQLQAVLETDKGQMRIGFFPEKAPKTVFNFLKLAQDGFYDGLLFHRVIKDFMVQGGCPNGSGTGGPGYTIDAEFNDTEHRRGVISMARSQDPNSAGSQFFIVHADHAGHLDGKYTAFGQLVEGEETLDAIATIDCEYSSTGERSVPVQPVRLQAVRIQSLGSGGEACDGEPAPGAQESGEDAPGGEANKNQDGGSDE